MRKMGLEPTRCCHHKILSLARLPVPTLPHRFNIICHDDFKIISNVEKNVNVFVRKNLYKKRGFFLDFSLKKGYNNIRQFCTDIFYAGVAELADAQASGACGSNTVWVQVPSSARKTKEAP